MNQELLLAQFDALLPLAAAWATEQEQEILRDIVSLFANSANARVDVHSYVDSSNRI
jgi:hypothetical protein